MGVSSDEENDRDESNDDGPMTPKRKRLSRGELPKSEQPKHRGTQFSKVAPKYPFLKADPTDEYKCICKICNNKPFRSETSDIDRHTNGKKHKQKVQLLRPESQRNLTSMLNKNPDPLEKQVKYAELKLAGFVAAHDESFLKMDHLTDVLKDIFPDSKIAKGLSLKRTKTRGLVVNVIGEAEKEELVATLKTTKVSILTDESTDISAVKTAAIMVQYYCPVAKGIVVRHWELDDIFTEDDPEGAAIGATAEALFTKLMATFEAKAIPVENIIGFGSDGTNSMMGAHNSLASRFKELCPGIKISKCICHSLHLCASDACKVLPTVCEDLARLIYGFFSHSSKRQAQFKQFQKFFELDIHKILHPSQTRWLSLTAVVSRILENWEALRLFFIDQSLTARLKAADNIVSHMRNPSIKAYFLFLNWVLPKVTGLNEYFQSEKPTITIIHSKMVQAYQEFLLMYMQREFVMRTPLHLINLADASRYIPTSNMYLGVDVSEYLQSPAVAGNPQMVQDILVRAQMFLVTLCTKIKEKYDFNDPILSRMRVLNPEAALSHRERDTTPSIATLCFLLPRCVSRDQVQAVDDEWRRLPLLAQDLPDEVKSIQEVDKFWHAMLHYKTEHGEQPFKALPEFALAALSIPLSNASCERDFSKINNIKTKKRNKLITPTVNGCLLASQAVRKGEGCCVKFKPTDPMYSGMTSANVYKKARPQREENNNEEVDIGSLFTFE